MAIPPELWPHFPASVVSSMSWCGCQSQMTRPWCLLLISHVVFVSLEDLPIKRESGFLPKLQGIFIAGGKLSVSHSPPSWPACPSDVKDVGGTSHHGGLTALPRMHGWHFLSFDSPCVF